MVNATTGLDEGSVSDKASLVFRYLKEVAELRSTTVRSVTEYERVLWLSDIPKEPEVFSVVSQTSGKRDAEDDWIEIRKPRAAVQPPQAPSIVLPWVDGSELANSEFDEPELRKSISKPTDDSHEVKTEVTSGKSPVLHLEDHPDVTTSWKSYVSQKWLPWAVEDRRRRSIQRVYDDLFSIHQTQQRLGEQYEVVLGIGLLNWNPNSIRVQRHIVTAQAIVEFDAKRGHISVKASPEGARLQLEEDMLDPADRPPSFIQRQLQERLTDLDNAIWTPEVMDEILESWVNALSSSGAYDPSLEIVPYRGPNPLITFGPAIILRRRSERSMIQMFDDIAGQLQSGDSEVPLGIRRLVEVEDDANYREGSAGDTDSFRSSGEVYFPLLANGEQREIVERLSERQGVLVQGPPGTGKSHTIANLICHVLANGQRVLVTSHTARALEVLKDKIPPQVADLCVSLLGDDRSAMKDLENSVAGITSRHGKWHPSNSAKRVKDLEEALAYTRSAAALAINSLQQYREKETLHFSVIEGYSGTASDIAMQINAERESLGWISDDVGISQPPPISDDEFQELISLIRNVSPSQQVESKRPRLTLSDIVDPEAFEQLVATERSILEFGAVTGFRESDPEILHAQASNSTDRQAILTALSDLLPSLTSSGKEASDWTQGARSDILSGRTAIWNHLADETETLMNTISAFPAALRTATVEGISPRTLETVLDDLDPLIAHLASGGSLGFGPFRPKEVKQAGYILDAVRLGGRKCNDLDTLQELRKWLDANINLARLRTLWTDYTVVRSSSFEAQYLELNELGTTVRGLLDLARRTSDANELVRKVPQITVTDWNSTLVEQAIRVLKGSLWLDNLAESRRPIDQIAKAGDKHLSRTQDPHPTSRLLMEAIKNRSVSEYRATFAAILELERISTTVNRAMELGTRLASKAPVTAREVGESALQDIWANRAREFEKAWNWKRASRWLDDLSDPGKHEATQNNLAQCQSDIQSLLAELAAEKAWVHFFERLTERERQALGSWALSVRKLGKGTGKHAARHRAEARAAMDECRSAIPAWVMPMYRVAQSISPEPGIFDVVIIDEASQSGPDALFLQYIAKRIVVVGDDKQISPEAIGTQRSDILALRDRYLKGVRNAVHLGVDNSLFDLASILFSGRIRLREHFRCMPEIIQFSNQLSYADDPLIPLKQFGMDRLTPVRTTHVIDGYQAGSANNIRNPNEAKAIAEEIKRCIELPEYNGLTMGVISLRGKAQAKEIEQRLLETIGAEVMEERQIHCGDAYSFQGDERDIIFMSMVSSRADEKGGQGSRIRALTSAADERRFNVAASRAREQMWLFHSVTLDDLSDRCLRYQLLDYCLAPRVASQHRDELPVDIFDSPFEQSVYEDIRSRGYRVLPQYAVSNYRIDLVVEGMQGRLAVECDGDRWHGPDRYQADMERQRQLERCGWSFWRIRGSEYYRDRTSAMASLWTLLESHGIHPETVGSSVALAASHSATVTIGGRTNPMPTITEPEAGSPNGEDPLEEDPFEAGVAESTGWNDVQKDIAAKLDAFRAWEIRPLPRPEPDLLEDIGSGVVEIVLAEGPVLGSRILKLYQRACGIREFGPEERQLLTSTLESLVEKGHLEKSEELGRSSSLYSIYHHPSSPRVVGRKVGNRPFEAIPPSELASVLVKLSNESSRVDRNREEVAEFLGALLAIYDEHYMDWNSSQRRHLKHVMNLTKPDDIGPLYKSIRDHLAM